MYVFNRVYLALHPPPRLHPTVVPNVHTNIDCRGPVPFDDLATAHQVQQVPEEEVTLREHVHGLLLKANGNNKHLVSSAASDCLLNAGLGLRFVQVPAIMSAVEEGVDGMVAAEEVASAVAGVMCALKQLDTRQRESPEDETVSKFKAARQVMCLVKIGGFDADEFKVRGGGCRLVFRHLPVGLAATCWPLKRHHGDFYYLFIYLFKDTRCDFLRGFIPRTWS